jgi:hypothetical protein
MKKGLRKLNLNRETLAPMQSDDLSNVNGGMSRVPDPPWSWSYTNPSNPSYPSISLPKTPSFSVPTSASLR